MAPVSDSLIGARASPGKVFGGSGTGLEGNNSRVVGVDVHCGQVLTVGGAGDAEVVVKFENFAHGVVREFVVSGHLEMRPMSRLVRSEWAGLQLWAWRRGVGRAARVDAFDGVPDRLLVQYPHHEQTQLECTGNDEGWL